LQPGGQRYHLLGRQQRFGQLGLSRTRAAALVVAAISAATVCGCGESSSADQPPLPAAYPTKTPAATVAQAQAPDDDATSTAPAGTPDDATEAPPAKAKVKAASRAILSSADRRSFAALERSTGSPIGVAVSGLGLDQKVQAAGTLRQAIAWSTSKVPVAMAVYAAGQGEAHSADLRQAITASDNAAAERLWTALGGGQIAANAADGQLRAAGDSQTQIQAQRLRAGFTPFGQTSWKLTDQARFVAGMPCSDAGLRVLDLMRQTIPGQRWGLGSAGVQAELKGGWGPGTQPGVGGGYLDRQMGILSIHGKPLAVTIAAQPADGQHGTGTAQLTRIARWVVAHADVRHVPTRARCG
jgi:hypothetical protein